MIAAAFYLQQGLEVVLGAYLLGKVILGLGMFFTAQLQLRRAIQRWWWTASVRSLPGLMDMVKFAVSSNLSATAILVFRESEILWVGFFLSSEAAGYYKAAYAIISLLSVPANPLILTVYPEINRLIVQKAWPRLRDFLRKVTGISFGINSLLAIGLVVFGRWVLWIYGEQYVVAYPALMALLVGFVFNYTLFWNRPLLLSFGLPQYPLKATVVAGSDQGSPGIPARATIGVRGRSGLAVVLLHCFRRSDRLARCQRDRLSDDFAGIVICTLVNMKIALITNSRIPSLTANSIQAMKVCQALAQLGHQVRLFAPREAEPASWETLAAHYGLSTPFEVRWLPSTPVFKRYDFSIYSILAARGFNAELVYTWLLNPAALASRLGWPVLLEMHAEVTGRMGPWLMRRFCRSSSLSACWSPPARCGIRSKRWSGCSFRRRRCRSRRTVWTLRSTRACRRQRKPAVNWVCRTD